MCPSNLLSNNSTETSNTSANDTPIDNSQSNVSTSASSNDDGTTIENTIRHAFRRENIDRTDVPRVSDYSVDQILAVTKRADHEAVNTLMLEFLSPELKNNEIQKRDLKNKLMAYIQKALWIQLIAIAIVVSAIIVVVCFRCPVETIAENIGAMFNFLQYYITAIIAEFIAMLFFIVRFVFDKSIVELLGDTIGKKHRKRKKRKKHKNKEKNKSEQDE